MANLNLDINYFDHLKTKKLVDLLGKGAEILPIKLWCYTAKHYAIDGKLPRHTADDIENVLGWAGEKGACTRALTETNFIKAKRSGFWVNGWLEWSGHLSASKIKATNAANARWSKLADKKKDDAQASPSIALTLPTQPTKHYLPNPQGQASRCKAAKVGNESDGGDGRGVGREGQKILSGVSITDSSERMIKVQSALSRYGVGAEMTKRLMIRHDITADLVAATIREIDAAKNVDDRPALLVSKLRNHQPGAKP